MKSIYFNYLLFSLTCDKQGEKISTLVKSANVKVEPYWPGLFAKLLEKKSVEDLILNVGAGGGGAPAAAAPGAGAPAGGAAAPPPEEKKVIFLFDI